MGVIACRGMTCSVAPLFKQDLACCFASSAGGEPACVTTVREALGELCAARIGPTAPTDCFREAAGPDYSDGDPFVRSTQVRRSEGALRTALRGRPDSLHGGE